MITKEYYIENSAELTEALEEIEEFIPCWVEREFIEMDYSKVIIKAREEDLASVERMLAPLM